MKKWGYCLFILVFFVCLVLPVVATDGGKIVFSAMRDDYYEIFIMNADGTGQTRLTTNLFNDYEPSLSPDCSKIAFLSDRDGNPEIYRMNADGTGQTRLTNSHDEDYEPDWSPDGSKIVFVSNRDHNFEIYVMNADGTGQTRLTNTESKDRNPAWSPDGKKIAFNTVISPPAGIYVMNSDGTGMTRLTHDCGYPAWSPDGSKIAFICEDDPDIYVMNSDGTGREPLTTNAGSGVYDGEPTWSPDGSKIAFRSITIPSSLGLNGIYVLNLDGTGTRTRLSTEGNEPDWGCTPTEAVRDLITKVDGKGLPKGIEQSLLAKLNVAEKKITQEQYTPARNTLKAFINEVNAQRGKALTTAQANDLIATAQRIINAIPGK